jgi:hypothetical protein
MDAGTAVAWETLQFDWDTAYVFRHDCGVFTAQRRDDFTVLSADTIDALRDKVAADYRAQKVPRDLAPDDTLEDASS